MPTASCHINLREGRIPFEVKGRFAVFSYKKKGIVSPNSSILDALSLSPEVDMEDV